MAKKTKGKFFKEVFLFKISAYSILCIIAGIILNIIGQKLAETLQMPFWLDTVGTMIVSILLGPLAGMITGAATNAILGIFSPVMFSYLGLAVVVGLNVGLFFSDAVTGGKKREPFEIISIAILTALLVSALSIPLDVMNFDGQTGNVWGDAFYDMLSTEVSNVFFCALVSKLFLELPDKVISILIAWFITWLLNKIIPAAKNSGGSVRKSTGKKIATLLIFALTASTAASLIPSEKALRAEELNAEFETVVYGRGNGMLSSEINAVAQTPDGYLWVGTYSGLYRYDGIRFEEVDNNEIIKNVMTLFVDSQGKLWIGTNDSGAVCFNPNTRNGVVYNTLMSLSADTIRQFCEDTAGNIYVATSRHISKITPDHKIKTYSEWDDIFYVQDFAALPTGEVAGVTNSGTLFLIKDDLLLDTVTFDSGTALSYRSLAYSSKTGKLLAGTDDKAYEFLTVENGHFVHGKTGTLATNSYFNDIAYDEDYGGYFFSCENGMGFLEETTGKYSEMTIESVKGAVSAVCVDDQKNIWFASNKYGLVKYSRSPFINPLSRASVNSGVVNALYKDLDTLLIATDTGLTALNLSTYQPIHLPYAETLKGVRIRNIMKDSDGNLWYSTYSKDGLIRVDPSGNIKTFNESNSKMLGGRARCAIELSDGRVLASSNVGLTFIQGDEVVATIGVDNGLNNQYILNMYEREDGSILAASDGDGIYIIRNDRVAGHIGRDEGLNTAVVLKIVKCTGGFLYVTSNALYYDDGSSIRQLRKFPYSNNYDILITEDHMCWITSSAGLYIVSEEALLADEDYTCTLLNESWGLTTTFTANSFNILEDDQMYLCCTSGVRIISATNYDQLSSDFQMHISSIVRGDEVFTEKDGKYVISAGGGRITFNLAVNNYSLSNPLVHYYLEGSDDEGLTLFQDEIQPLSFTNLSHGEYKFHIEIIDSATGKIMKERVFDVTKESRMYERTYFQIYLYIVSVFIVMYIVWLFVTIHRKTRRIVGLQREISTDKMTGLLNKAGATKTLETLCREEPGCLMMIDLDSFKLVNDIYGHDMGDRILIRFSELIREALGEGNCAGRMGGDEFIGYLKNEMDEDRVAEITRYLNRELVKSAKEYMGEDMEIPLGTSIGVVRVPLEGTDFHELFKLADKALYMVKQNGKHGYAFYQRSGGEKGEEQKDRNDLSEIKKIIGERNEGKGAYLVNFDRLQALYKYISRNDRATGNRSGFLRFTIDAPEEEKIPDEILDSFEDTVITGFRKNDVVSRYSTSFYILCAGADPETAGKRAEEIMTNWKEEHNDSNVEVILDVESIGGD